MKMNLCIIFIYQFFILLRANAQQIPWSPCPAMYYYEFVGQPRDSVYASVRGVITVQPERTIVLRVKLQLPVILNYKYFGEIKLKDGNYELFEKFSSGTLNKVVFHMYFQKDLPVPEVVQIIVNNRLLCWSTPTKGKRAYTNIELIHWLTTESTRLSYEDMKTITTNRKLEYRAIPNVYEIPKIPSKQNYPWEMRGFENCGLEYTQVNSHIGVHKLIVGGSTVERGQGPWMVPLFLNVKNRLHFFCTSTLISEEYVITAAHCIKTYSETERSSMIAYVGLYNISNQREENTQMRRISRFHIYPYYEDDVDYDLAVLKLSQKVKVNRYVNPVCVWTQEEDLRFVEGREATVFGWGKDGRGHDFVDTPRVSRIPIVSQETCRKSNPNFLKLTSSRTLCAGSRNGNGPCNGDSGGGLLLTVKDNRFQKRWILRGVTSSSLKGYHDTCDLENYIIFSDVSKYKNWILQFIANTIY